MSKKCKFERSQNVFYELLKGMNWYEYFKKCKDEIPALFCDKNMNFK